MSNGGDRMRAYRARQSGALKRSLLRITWRDELRELGRWAGNYAMHWVWMLVSRSYRFAYLHANTESAQVRRARAQVRWAVLAALLSAATLVFEIRSE